MCPHISMLSGKPAVNIENKLQNFKTFIFSKGKQYKTIQNTCRTENINANIGGFLVNDEFSYVFQVAPEQEKPEILIKNLKTKISEMALAGGKVWGFICGGWAFDPKNEVAQQSCKLYSAIAETFENEGVPFGMVCGKDIGENYDNIRISENRVFMWGDKLKGLFKKGESKEEIIEKLKNEGYSDVEFSDEIILDSV